MTQIVKPDGSVTEFDGTTQELSDLRAMRYSADSSEKATALWEAGRQRLLDAAQNPAACEGEAELEERREQLAGKSTGPKRDTSPAARARDLARTVVDSLHRKGKLADAPAALVEAHLNGADGSGQPATAGETDAFAKYVNVAGSEDYLAAFSKVLADPRAGHTLFEPAEAAAWRDAHAYANTALSTGNGSSMLPLVLDPAIMLTNAGSEGGIRQVARTVQIAQGNAWNGVTSAGATAEWKAEGAEAADGTPAVAGKAVPVYTLDVDALVSYEMAADAVNFAAELAAVLTDAAVLKVDAALATGTGTGQPTGVITSLTAVTTQYVATGGTFSAANVVALQNALPARFQPNASFVAPLAVVNQISSFETTAGALRFPEVADGRLLRRRLVEDSNISSDMTTAGSKFAVYGDWGNYLIASRVGSTIEVLPGYGTNGRPTAQKHFFLTMRLGADVLITNAFRLLNKS